MSRTSGSIQRLPWTPALDGLRGLAVLSVMVFHFGEWFGGGSSVGLPGGSLGVDVFFVLSGFLITHLLLVELHSKGTIDIRRFYRRRALRLLPALVAIMAVFALIFLIFNGAGFTGPQPRSVLPRSAAAVTTYSLNWVSALGGDRAWGLGHLWSLAVEEQFYLVWPVVVVALWRVGRGHRSFLWGTGIMFVVSASLPLWIHDADRLYFGTDFRLQQLAVGCILAQLYTSGALTAGVVGRRIFQSLVVVSATFLVLIVVLLQDRDRFILAGGSTLVGVASGFVVAGALFVGSGVSAIALTNRFIVYVGKRSYALYLWHYPIAIWLRDLGWVSYVLVASTLSFALAEASYRFVERPVLALKDSGWTFANLSRRRGEREPISLGRRRARS